MSSRLCEYNDCINHCGNNKLYCIQHSKKRARPKYTERCFLCTRLAMYRANHYYFCDVHKTIKSLTISKYKCKFPGCETRERQPSFVMLNFCQFHRNEIYR